MKKSIQSRLALVNMRGMAKAAGVSITAFAALVASQGAQAAIDIAAATTGISDAQTAVLAVLAGLLTLSIAAWGVKKVLKFFGH